MEEIILKQTDKMIKLYKKAQKQKFPEPHIITITNVSKYTEVELENDFKDINDINSIYVISTDKLPFTSDEIKNAFNDEREKRNGVYHVSKINNYHDWDKKNSLCILYVGSKVKNVKRRLKEHLALLYSDSRTTYALYIKDWWDWESKIIINLWFFGDSIDSEVLQIIEDSIWDEYQPIFGKKGSTFNKKPVNS